MKRLVMTIGTFDGIHVGHINLIKQCRVIAGPDPVWVGVNTSKLALSRGKKLMQECAARRSVLNAVRDVDGTFAYDGDRSSLFAWICQFKKMMAIEQFILVVGGDWFGRYYKLMKFTPEWLESNGVTVVYVDHTEGVSSTEWRKREQAKRPRRRADAKPR